MISKAKRTGGVIWLSPIAAPSRSRAKRRAARRKRLLRVYPLRTCVGSQGAAYAFRNPIRGRPVWAALIVLITHARYLTRH